MSRETDYTLTERAAPFVRVRIVLLGGLAVAIIVIAFCYFVSLWM